MTDPLLGLTRLIAEEGADWADGYEEYAAENTDFVPYWDIAVDAIRDNTVANIEFGRQCMLDTIARYPIETTDPGVVLCALVAALDQAAKDLRG